MREKIPVVPTAVGCVVFLFVAWVVWRSACAGKPLLDIAGFAVLALTLVVLVFYAYDTYSIARVTRENREPRGAYATAYAMHCHPESQIARGRTMFQIENRSTLVVRARVRCNFRVYGHPVDSQKPSLEGAKLWVAFPQQASIGWFEIEALVQQQGKSIVQMKAEHRPENRETQLTMDLEIEFRDELGASRVLPSRHQFFDFAEWAWIPELTTEDDWN